MKKRNKWYLFIIVVSVVLIGFGGYWAFNFKEEATSAVVENMKVQVLSQETTDQVGTSEWKKKATGTFLILDAEMTNQANKEQPASLLTFKIKDTKTKKEYPLSESATISNALNKDGKMKDVFFLSTLAKGESKEGQLVFEMPAKAAKADSLELVISSTKTAQQKSIKIQN